MRGKPEHSIKEAQRRHRLDRPLPGSVAKLTKSRPSMTTISSCRQLSTSCVNTEDLVVSCASRQMLFMDEPTAAVDAGAKRHLWKVWPGAV